MVAISENSYEFCVIGTSTKIRVLEREKVSVVVSRELTEVIYPGPGTIRNNFLLSFFFPLLPCCASTVKEPETPVRKPREQKS